VEKFTTKFIRSNLEESIHKIKILVTNLNEEILLSSGNDNDYIYPRSSIKIFQAIPFIKSNAVKKFNLTSKSIALACSSHRGEYYHIKELENWIKKTGIKVKNLKCGIHNPLNLIASEKIMRSNNNVNQLHNNCAGKHMAMITSSLVNNYNVNNYLNFNHPHQLEIRSVFEKFINKKIKNKNFGIDGCSAPQYSFKIKDIAKMLRNLIKSYNGKFEYSREVQQLIKCILLNPKFIGGSDSLDSRIMNISNNKIFCKGGAEGVFLFIDLKKGIVGVIKVVDGNERAIPSITYNLFKKFKNMNTQELINFKKFYNFKIINHTKNIVGSVETKI